MIARIRRWLGLDTPEAAPEAEAPPKRPRLYSTDDDHEPATRWERLRDYVSALGSRAPVATEQGTGMDSLDGSDDGASSRLKDVYQIGEDNYSSALVGWFLSQGFIGHQIAGLLAQHWLINKACEMPARDAVRKGFVVHTVDGDEIEAPEALRLLARLDKRYQLNRNLVEWVHKGKIFGIRIAYFKVDSADPDYYEKPFNPDGVTPGSYKGIVQVDPYWCAPELDAAAAANPTSMHFYEPTWWQINGKRYHRSHLVIYKESDPVDILKPSYLYGGVPVPQKIMERVYAAERTANEAPQLSMTKRRQVLQTDMDEMLALGPASHARLQRLTDAADNYGWSVIDKEDTVSQYDVSLADLDTVIMTQYQVVAAIANVPATKLLGTSPKGFGASGEYEEANYHEELESIQTEMSRLVDRHHLLCMLAHVVPYMRKTDDSFQAIETAINWNPLDSLTAAEQATVNLTKAQTDQALQATGGIDQYDVRARLIGDKTSGYSSIDPAERPDEDGDGEPDGPTMTPAAAAPAGGGGFDSADEVELITNQTYLDPERVRMKQEAGDYDVQVTPAFLEPVTGRMYRVVIDGHHSLEAARIDGVAPNLVEGGFGESDYVDVETGEPLPML